MYSAAAALMCFLIKTFEGLIALYYTTVPSHFTSAGLESTVLMFYIKG